MAVRKRPGMVTERIKNLPPVLRRFTVPNLFRASRYHHLPGTEAQSLEMPGNGVRDPGAWGSQTFPGGEETW